MSWAADAYSRSRPRSAADAGSGCEGTLYGLWDAIWFGEDSPDCSSSINPTGGIRTRHKSAFPADPLDNVIPMGYDPLLAALQPPGGLSALPSANVLQQQQQQQQQLQEHLQQAYQQQQQQQSAHYNVGQMAAPLAAIPAPSQARAVRVPSGTAAASAAQGRAATHADSSTAGRMEQQQAQAHGQQQQQDQHAGQQQQQAPAPFVLGTWAQRQYIMPVQRPTQPINSTAAAPTPAAGGSSQHRASSSPARPIPNNGRYPLSNGSSHSSGASTRGKPARAAAGAAHSSSGASSEAVPTAAAEEAEEQAAAAAAAAGQPGGHGGVEDAVAVAMWQEAAARNDDAQQQLQEQQREGRPSLGTDEEDEMVQQIAWRWRFARRWQAEQARGPLDPNVTASPGDGGMEEALQYLAACGENWHCLSRGSSHLGTLDSKLLGTLGSVGTLGAELLAEDGSFSFASGASGLQGALLQGTADSSGPLAASCQSRDASISGQPTPGMLEQLQQAPQQQQQPSQQQQQQPNQQQQQQQRRRPQAAPAPRGEATVQVSGIARHAQQLLAAQHGIHQAAQERWREASAVKGASLWVGALLEPVQVDSWGKFKFLLLRVRDRNGRQVLLVRGANNATEGAIIDALHKQMIAACAAQDLPSEPIEVVGGGVMEWTQHRDRHLHISGGYVSRASGPSGGPSSATEVMRLAAVLTQQVLPMHYKVTSDT